MKNTVIVGGSSGIGLAIAQRMTADGHAVTNISRKPCAVAGVKNVLADVTDADALKAAFDEIPEIDTLIYCAGASLAAPIEYVRRDDVQYIFSVNVIGATECLKYAIPKLEKSETPKAVLLSSSGGITPIAFDSFYSATKAGLIALAAAVRLERPRVRCTAVIVPATQTQFSFKRKVYTDCGEYDKKLKTATDALIKMEQTGYSADYVAKRIVALTQKNDPPPKVTVGTKNKLSMFAYKILPWRLKLYVLKKIYGI